MGNFYNNNIKNTNIAVKGGLFLLKIIFNDIYQRNKAEFSKKKLKLIREETFGTEEKMKNTLYNIRTD